MSEYTFPIERFFELIVAVELILLVVIIVMGMGFYLYEYYHPTMPDHGSEAGKALRRRTRRVRMVASDILRNKTRSKANMTAAGRALDQRHKA